MVEMSLTNELSNFGSTFHLQKTDEKLKDKRFWACGSKLPRELKKKKEKERKRKPRKLLVKFPTCRSLVAF